MRMERLQEEVREVISEILQNRVSDRRIGMVGVTRVEVSKDLSHARVFVSALGDDAAQEQSLRALMHARGFVRVELSHRLRARRVPELEFRADPGIRYSVRLQQLLLELGLHSTDSPAGGAAADEEA
jgi:ribosome-binding factor A